MKKLNEIIGFIGAGNMATALISGLINNGHEPSKIISSSPEKGHLEKLSRDFGVMTSTDNQKVLEESKILMEKSLQNIKESPEELLENILKALQLRRRTLLYLSLMN